MKATDLLKKQHQQAKELLETLRNCDVEDRRQCLADVSRLLRGHTQIEEELLYPRLEDQDAFEDLVSDSFREHEEMKSALADLERCAPEDEEYADLVEKLEETVLLHVDSEESETLSKVERAWTNEALHDLGSQMRRRYEELQHGEEARL